MSWSEHIIILSSFIQSKNSDVTDHVHDMQHVLPLVRAVFSQHTQPLQLLTVTQAAEKHGVQGQVGLLYPGLLMGYTGENTMGSGALQC